MAPMIGMMMPPTIDDTIASNAAPIMNAAGTNLL